MQNQQRKVRAYQISGISHKGLSMQDIIFPEKLKYRWPSVVILCTMYVIGIINMSRMGEGEVAVLLFDSRQ